MPPRCAWVTDDPLYIAYHDDEWGVPVHHDRALFELLCLEGAQAGLSWLTILRKRPAYREAFAGFEPARIARFTARDRARLLRDPGIVRNRLKIAATIDNARACLRCFPEPGSFARFLWTFVGGKPRRNRPRRPQDIPARTPESVAMSKELRRRGFRFVGPTICYAFMQAAGLVNDHLTKCVKYASRAGSARQGAARGRSCSRGNLCLPAAGRAAGKPRAP